MRSLSPTCLLALTVLSSCLAPDLPSPYIQLLGGETRLDDGDRILRSNTPGTPDFDLGRPATFGLVQQVAMNRHQDRWVDFGLETGALFSWEYEKDTVQSGVSTLEVRDEMLWIDGLLGAYAAMPLFRERLRVYAAAGPLLLWGHFEQRIEDLATGLETEEDDYSLRVGAYARAGAEFRIFEGGYLGVGVRGLRSRVDFGGFGDVDVDATQYFLTYSVQF